MPAITRIRPITLQAFDRWSSKRLEWSFGFRGDEKVARLVVPGAPPLLLSKAFLNYVAAGWRAQAFVSQRSALRPAGFTSGIATYKLGRWNAEDVIFLARSATAPGATPPVIIDRDIWELAAEEGWTVALPSCAVHEHRRTGRAGAHGGATRH